MVHVPRAYRSWVSTASGETGVPYEVVADQIDLESGFDPTVVSPAGAEGIAQFEPGTFDQYGPAGGSPFNVRDARIAYVNFMRKLLRDQGGSVRQALAAYNAGEANLQAGYGYADTILQEAGEPPSLKASPKNVLAGYANPFRDVQNLTAERIDMGVDYQGTGPVHPLGPGVITASNTDWAGGVGAVGPGTWIVEKLSSGPAAGHQVYISENITSNVQVGQEVGPDDVIGYMTGQGAGIETGWAAAGAPGTQGETLAASLGQQDPGSDPGGWSTAAGVSYSNVIHALGGKPGVMTPGGPHGNLPSWLHWADVPIIGPIIGGGGGGGGILGGLGDIGTALKSIAQVVQDIEHFIEWWTVPSHWIRIFSGVAGTIFITWGLWSISRTGRAYSANVPVVGTIPVPEGGQIAPALGIASVTVGAILLFIAFHNLPSNVTDIGSLFSYLQAGAQGKLQGGGSSLG